jgi:uncharacterized iron-regulated membrane protein
MSPRKVVFWCHLTVGSIAGLVILTMCVSGVLLTYQRQVIHFAERSYRAAPPTDARPLPLQTLLETARAVQPSAPVSIIWRSNPDEPVEVAFSRSQSLLLNPYTGAILGEGAAHTRAFFHTVEDCHRWLAFAPANRTMGRAVTGACNLAFLFLVCSGPYLWLPRTWSRASVKAGTWLNRRLAGKARDFNWHNVIGFWCCLPLAVIVLCAVVMSYPWANNLVYRATNNPVPLQNATQLAAGAGPNGQRGHAGPLTPVSWDNLDLLRHHAEQRVQGWQTITLRLPPQSDPNVTFSIDSGSGGRPDTRAQLTLNRKTAEELRWEPFSSYNSGRRLRSWIRFTHTGEAGGVLGQTMAAVAALGGAFLVWTGLSLAFRRLRAKFARASAVGVPPCAVNPLPLVASGDETHPRTNTTG